VEFIDSHAHLADPAFDVDREETMARARDAGARAIVCVGESVAAADRALALARRAPGFVFHTAGVHPHDAAGYDPARDGEAIRAHVDAGAVAIGECGLDYHYDNSPRDAQRAAFAHQLSIAAEIGYPVVVHSRSSDDDMAAMVTDAATAGVTGVLHCFTGSTALAATALDAGWYISFSGIVTFRKWTDDALLRLAPDDRLLVESDAPYLAPVPNRGRRNEPAFVPFTITRLAMARGTSGTEVALSTTNNARTLFGLEGP
jgi:TatD DNase family protein